MSNKEILQSNNTKLNKNNTSLDSILESINKLPENKELSLQDKEVTPSKEVQTITSDDGYDALNQVTVNPIPDSYVEPSGSLDIVANGEYDVKNYEKAVVNVEGASGPYTPRQISFYNYGGSNLDYEVANLDTINMTRFNVAGWGILESCAGITSLDLSHWNTSNVTIMNSLFAHDAKLTTLNVNGWDTSKVTTMAYMFYGCQKMARLDLSSWYTPNLTNTSNMFYNGGVNAWEHLDIRNFDFSKVTNSSNMFGSASYHFRANCEIIVKDETAKQWILGVRSDLSNVKTVAEYEAEQQSL